MSRSPRSARSRVLLGIVVPLLLVVSGLAVISKRKADSPSAPSGSARLAAVAEENFQSSALRQQVPRSFAERLKPVSNPRFIDPRAADLQASWPATDRYPMTGAAQSEPFRYALLKGRSEGTLSVTERANGITTLTVSFLPSRRQSLAEREILRNIDLGLAGPFSIFMANLKGAPAEAAAAGPEPTAETGKENPFSRVLDSLKEQAKEKQSAEVAPKPEQQPSPQTAQADPVDSPASKPAAAEVAPILASGPPKTKRPHLMLHVDAGGQLRALPASQPRAGALESAELGLRDFNILSFSDAAEYPMSMAAGDFDRDGIADLAVHIPQSGFIRVYYGGKGGTFAERLRIQAGRFPTSLAAGDFDGDGWTDLVISEPGVGIVTLLYGSEATPFQSFRSYWVDTYRDYTAAADIAGGGVSEVLGMSFGHLATVLVDFGRSERGRKVDFVPAVETRLNAGIDRSVRLEGIMLGSALMVNVENRNFLLQNVLNLGAGTAAYVILGDLEQKGTLDVGIAIPIQ